MAGLDFFSADPRAHEVQPSRGKDGEVVLPLRLTKNHQDAEDKIKNDMYSKEWRGCSRQQAFETKKKKK